MWRVDVLKDGEQYPLVIEVPNEQLAKAIVQTFGDPCDAWDTLVAVNDGEEE